MMRRSTAWLRPNLSARRTLLSLLVARRACSPRRDPGPLRSTQRRYICFARPRVGRCKCLEGWSYTASPAGGSQFRRAIFRARICGIPASPTRGPRVTERHPVHGVQPGSDAALRGRNPVRIADRERAAAIGNAIKFTTQGEIVVRVERASSAAIRGCTCISC